MELIKLIDGNINDIKNKKIYCYEKYPNYMLELVHKFPMLKSQIAGIVDDNRRNLGNIIIDDQEFLIESTKILENEELSNTEIIITSDYYIEAYNRIKNTPYISDKIERIYYFLTKETEIEEEYRKRFEKDDLRNLIIFRSGPHASSYVKGMDFSDNSKALFDYMLKIGLNHKYELVWFVKNPENYVSWTQKYENVHFISFDWNKSMDISVREKYFDVLLHAKYIFFTDAYGFARNCRSDQIRVQLWHGYGLKSRVFFSRCEFRYEYLTVVSSFFGNIHQQLFGLRKDQILVTGYAKDDYLYHPRNDWREILKIPKADRYIMWAPTFRASVNALPELNETAPKDDIGLPIISNNIEMEKINSLLKENDAFLLIKLHPFQDLSRIHVDNYSNIGIIDNEDLFMNDILITEILSFIDAMISDYSSIVMEYLLLDRPVAITIDDIEEYEKNRGFVVNPIKEWLPGVIISDFLDFKSFIDEVLSNQDSSKEKRRKIIDKVHDYFDDQSCQRIINALGIN